jgi:hypothetical protein
MDPLIVLILLIAIAVVFSGRTHAPETPQVIVVHALPPEPEAQGWGCFPWIVIGMIGLLVFWASQGG